MTRRSIGNAASLNNNGILAARCGDGGVIVNTFELDVGCCPTKGAIAELYGVREPIS